MKSIEQIKREKDELITELNKLVNEFKRNNPDWRVVVHGTSLWDEPELKNGIKTYVSISVTQSI